MKQYDSVGTEFLVEPRTRGLQVGPEISALPDGFVIAWTDDTHPACDIGGPDVRAKVFSTAGAAIRHAFLVNEETIGHQFGPKLATLSDGRCVLLWHDFSGRGGDSCSGGIKARIFNGNGIAIGNEFLVNVETAGHQIRPAIASLPDGAFVVAWQDHSETLGADAEVSVKARVFDQQGVPADREFLMSSHVGGHQGSPAVVGLPEGGFVVVWHDFNHPVQGGAHGSIKGKGFMRDGGVLLKEFVVATRSIKDNSLPVVAVTAKGFVIAWTDFGNSPERSRITAKSYGFNGGALSGEVLLVETANQNVPPRLLPLSDGFAVGWREVVANHEPGTSSIKIKRFDHSGASLDDELFLDLRTRGNGCFAAAALNNDSLVVVWEDGDPKSGMSLRGRILKVGN